MKEVKGIGITFYLDLFPPDVSYTNIQVINEQSLYYWAYVYNNLLVSYINTWKVFQRQVSHKALFLKLRLCVVVSSLMLRQKIIIYHSMYWLVFTLNKIVVLFTTISENCHLNTESERKINNDYKVCNGAKCFTFM